MTKKKKKKQTKQKAIIIATVIAIIVFTILILSILFKRDIAEENLLKTEINALATKDITKDRYNTKIKTTGDYQIVEKTIKKYKDDYAVTYQSILNTLTDEKILNMLSAENYKKDGPNFTKSLGYLQNTKAKFNNNIDKLTEMSSKHYIMNLIEKKNLKKYYNELYEELMFNSKSSTNLSKMKQTLYISSKKLNERIENEEEVINFLIKNSGGWQINNNKIVFKDTEKLNEYNKLIKKIQ